MNPKSEVESRGIWRPLFCIISFRYPVFPKVARARANGKFLQADPHRSGFIQGATHLILQVQVQEAIEQEKATSGPLTTVLRAKNIRYGRSATCRRHPHSYCNIEPSQQSQLSDLWPSSQKYWDMSLLLGATSSTPADSSVPPPSPPFRKGPWDHSRSQTSRAASTRWVYETTVSFTPQSNEILVTAPGEGDPN